MNKPTESASQKVYTVDSFKVGQFVHHRFWTLPLYDGDKQKPVVEKKPRRIMSIDGDSIRCSGGVEYRAFELIPSTWTPKS